MAPLCDLAAYHNGRGFKRSEWSAAGRPIIRIQNLTGSSSTVNHFEGDVDPRNEAPTGTILVSWAATLGAFVWKGPPGVINQHIFKVEPRIDGPFLLYTLRQALAALNRQTHGSGMVHITRNRFDSTEVPVAPLREQRRIVSALDSYFSRLDAAEAALQRVEANLKRYRASVLKAAVEGRLVPTEAELARKEGRDYEPATALLDRILVERRRKWEEAELAKMLAKGNPPATDRWKAKYREPTPPDTEGLSELPEGWCWASVDQLAAVGTGATPSRSEPGYWEQGSVPWVTSAVVNTPVVSAPSEFVTPRALAETNLTLYGPGTILVAMYGEGKTRGRATVLAIESATNQALAALTLEGSAESIRTWMLCALEYLYRSIRQSASGGVQPNLNLSIVKGLVVPLPPSDEQPRILGQVECATSVAHAASRAADTSRAKANRLRQSILKWAFEGRLVDQDPTDEPASVLLERIRAEREAAGARPNAKRATRKRKAKS